MHSNKITTLCSFTKNPSRMCLAYTVHASTSAWTKEDIVFLTT